MAGRRLSVVVGAESPRLLVVFDSRRSAVFRGHRVSHTRSSPRSRTRRCGRRSRRVWYPYSRHRVFHPTAVPHR